MRGCRGDGGFLWRLSLGESRCLSLLSLGRVLGADEGDLWRFLVDILGLLLLLDVVRCLTWDRALTGDLDRVSEAVHIFTRLSSVLILPFSASIESVMVVSWIFLCVISCFKSFSMSSSDGAIESAANKYLWLDISYI